MLDNVKKTGMRTCLVLCPLNTVLNWQTEFELWLKDITPLDVSAFDLIVILCNDLFLYIYCRFMSVSQCNQYCD